MRKISKKITLVIIFIVLIALFASILTLQHIFSEYKMKKNLSAYQRLELKTTVDNFIVMIDSMRKGITETAIDANIQPTHQEIKDSVLDFVRYQVHEMDYTNGSYIWINEVINWEGGDNYAIRLVHGNLPETEGMYLSTSMRDLKGNFPYLEELEGIKKNGDLYYEYYFKEYHSTDTSKKISYARLYPEYNWIVCVGTYYKDMYAPTGGVGMRENIFFYVIYSVIILTALILVAYSSVIFLNHSKKLKMQAEKLKEEVSVDSLTGASSRTFGKKILTKDFEEFKQSGTNRTIAFFDIDNFKTFNDTYGHNVGDEVIKTIVSTISEQLKQDDYIIRWGGDEFVIVYSDVRKNLDALLSDLNKKVAEQQIVTDNGQKIHFSISIGATLFYPIDNTLSDTIKRVDDALYLAKRDKNTHYVL